MRNGRKREPNRAKRAPESTKMTKMEPKGSQRAPKVSQRVPKGSQTGAKGSQKGAKGCQKWAQGCQKAIKMHLKVDLRKSFRKRDQKEWFPGIELAPFGSQNPLKINEKSMRKSMLFDSSKPRLAFYSSLISHFWHFRKTSKIDAKRDAKSLLFLSKNRPWAPQGRLILPFWSIFEDSKNRRFFDVVLGRQKIDKNRALERQGPKTVLRLFAERPVPGIGGPRPAPNIKENRRKKDQGLRSGS